MATWLLLLSSSADPSVSRGNLESVGPGMRCSERRAEANGKRGHGVLQVTGDMQRASPRSAAYSETTPRWPLVRGNRESVAAGLQRTFFGGTSWRDWVP
jgi:hypothetical protein